MLPVTGDAPILTEVPLQMVEGLGVTTNALGNGFSVIVNRIELVVAAAALYVNPIVYLILKSIVVVVETIGNEIPLKLEIDGLEFEEVVARLL